MRINQQGAIRHASTLVLLVINYALLMGLSSCSNTRIIRTQAQQYVINDSSLAAAHIGICVYNATDDKYLYNYQSDKYFIPASNTKIFTCYEAMKHLGDSLVGVRYEQKDSFLLIKPTGDPTFLHPDFVFQPVFDFFKNSPFKYLSFPSYEWNENAWGVGWSWDDYNDDYMAERSPFPIYGNLVNFSNITYTENNKNGVTEIRSRKIKTNPAYFLDSIKEMDGVIAYPPVKFSINRSIAENKFIAKGSSFPAKIAKDIPFVTNGVETFSRLLADTLDRPIQLVAQALPPFGITHEAFNTIHSQPTDSLLKIMMHRSDNFYAEQSLLMVSNEMLGTMNDEQIIDTLLKTDLKDLPQRPQWVDGSGLSRFNLFTPQDFVFMLNKMKNEYSWNRIATIFETGGTGTLNNYYKTLTGKIYAKTGSLSNNIALSGYLITPKNKTLIFSVLVNNHTLTATKVRRAVERFLLKAQADY